MSLNPQSRHPRLFEQLLSRLLAGRWGRIALGGIAGLAARSVTVLTLLVTVPFATSHLGPDRFGLWMLVSGFALIFGFADFGISGSILNAVGEAEARGDEAGAKEAIANGVAALAMIALVFLAAGLVAALTIDWPMLFGISDSVAALEATPAVIAFLICFALQLPLNIAGTVQGALQKTYLVGLVQIAGNLLGFVLTLAGLWAGWSVPILIAMLFGANAVAALCNTVLFFGFARPEFRPRISDVTYAKMRSHFAVGAVFFAMQLAAVGMIRFDPIIAANRFGLVAGGVYAAVDRLYAFAAVLAMAVVGPLWPAYRDAFARGDTDWWRRALILSTAGSMAIAAVMGLALVLARPILDDEWLRISTPVSTALFLAMTLLRMGEVGFGCLIALLAGFGRLRLALGLMVPMLAIGLLLKLLAPWSTPAPIAAVGGSVYLAGLLIGLFLFLRSERPKPLEC